MSNVGNRDFTNNFSIAQRQNSYLIVDGDDEQPFESLDFAEVNWGWRDCLLGPDSKPYFIEKTNANLRGERLYLNIRRSISGLEWQADWKTHARLSSNCDSTTTKNPSMGQSSLSLDRSSSVKE